EKFYPFFGYPPFGEVIARDLARSLIRQRALPSLGDLLVNLQQRILEMAGLFAAGATFVFERNFRAVRQALQRLRKIHAFVFHDEAEDVAPLLAPEALKDLQVWINIKTGRH